MFIYLDNCSLNRPFDDQSQIRIKLETIAKLHIQSMIFARELDLVWSYILDYENNANPFEERKVAIQQWRDRAKQIISGNPEIVSKAKFIQTEYRLGSADALHVACALSAKASYFITTDERIQKRAPIINKLRILNPVEFILIDKEERDA